MYAENSTKFIYLCPVFSLWYELKGLEITLFHGKH